MGQFLDALNEIAIAEEDKNLLSTLAAKYPDLDKKVVAASLYDTARTQVTDLTARYSEASTKLTDASTKLSAWDKWRAENWDDARGTTRTASDLQAKLAESAGRVATLEAAVAAGNGGDGNMLEIEQLKQFLAAEGVVTASQIAGLAPKADVEGVKQALNQQAVNFEHIYYGTLHLPQKFSREFGALNKDFNARAFVEYALADPTGARAKDLDAAYETYVAPMRQELEFSKKQAEFAAEKAAFDEKVAAAAAAATQHSATEGATDGTNGHFARRLLGQKDEKEIDVPLNNPNLAAMAAEQYRKGELTTVQ